MFMPFSTFPMYWAINKISMLLIQKKKTYGLDFPLINGAQHMGFFTFKWNVE